MKTKTITGGLAAAAAMLSLSGAAIADHGASCAAGLRHQIIQSAEFLVCNDGETRKKLGYSGTWPFASPLWQFRAGKLKNATEKERDEAGCEVHARVAASLYAISPNKKKPIRGVANALDPLDPNFEEAVFELEVFKESVDASDPNTDPTAKFPPLRDGSNSNPTQADWEAYLKRWADETIALVKACGHLP
jgi:hypothetical protein